MTEEQKDVLRRAAAVEPVAKQELRLMEQVARITAAAMKINKGMVELALTGKTSSYDMNDAMSDIQFAIGGMVVPLFQLRHLMELPEVDFMRAITDSVNVQIGNQARLLWALGKGAGHES